MTDRAYAGMVTGLAILAALCFGYSCNQLTRRDLREIEALDACVRAGRPPLDCQAAFSQYPVVRR